MGLAVRQPNKGAFVRILDVDEVMQIYEVRVALESLAARRIPLPPPLEVLANLHDIQALHQAAVESQDPRAAFRANIRFHAVLFGACGNVHLTELIRQSAHKVHGIRSMTDGDPAYLRRACEEHWQMIAALERGDRARLVTLCEQHIIPSRDLYLARAKSRRRPG
jgi:DNA-binding GntR family transcriptional regulator